MGTQERKEMSFLQSLLQTDVDRVADCRISRLDTQPFAHSHEIREKDAVSGMSAVSRTAKCSKSERKWGKLSPAEVPFE